MHYISSSKNYQEASSVFRGIVMQDLSVQIACAFAKVVLCESEMKGHCSVSRYCLVIGGCLLLLTLASQSMSRMMRSFRFVSLKDAVLEKKAATACKLCHI